MLEDVFSHVERAISILEAMDESVVARNATLIVKRALCRAKRVPHPAFTRTQESYTNSQEFPAQEANITRPATWTTITDGGGYGGESAVAPIAPTASANSVEGDVYDTIPLDEDLNWLNAFPFDDGQQALFWTEWAHELDILGT